MVREFWFAAGCLLAVEVKSDFMLEGLEDLSAGCRFTGNEILKIDTQTIIIIS